MTTETVTMTTTRSRVTESEVAVWTAWYRDGASLEQLARQTGRDRRVLRRVLIEAGVVLRGRRRTPVADPQWVIAEYQRGATLREVAEAAGCSHSSIRRALLRAGIPPRPQGTRPPSRQPGSG